MVQGQLIMRHLDLFSGIGGFALSASWVWDNHEIVGFCEIDKYCQKVLNKHWPEVNVYDDIYNLRGEDIGTVDIVTGGFPCQPFSNAGLRKGKEDHRHLWPEYLRIIQETRPRWVLGENVAGIINMELDQVLLDLEGENYSCQSVVIPACAVNAVHRRDRVWIIACSNEPRTKPNNRTDTEEKREIRRGEEGNVSSGYNEFANDKNTNGVGGGRGCKNSGQILGCETTEAEVKRPSSEAIVNSDNSPTTRHRENGRPIYRKSEPERFNVRCWDENWVEVATRLCRVDDGVSKRVDRLKALGNSIVPQVAYEILKAIKECDDQMG